jgi:signal peptidase I
MAERTPLQSPPVSAAQAAPQPSRWREYRSLLLMLALLLVTRTSLANHYTVPSGSMEPTLVPGDHVVVDMSAYGLRVPFTDKVLVERDAPARGDVVVFKSPVDGNRLIKRVVAVGGDTVSVRDGRVSINGQPLSSNQAPDIESFGRVQAQLSLADGGGPDVQALTLPAGQVLVMGDHRGSSFDGRYFGLVPAKALYARAVGVYWRSGEGPTWQKL